MQHAEGAPYVWRSYSPSHLVSLCKQSIAAWRDRYAEIGTEAAELAAGIVSLGIGRRACLAIATGNCIEWLISDFSCRSSNSIT